MGAFTEKIADQDTQYMTVPASPTLDTRVRAVQKSARPLLVAACPLLDALASTPAALDEAAIVQYRQWLEQELRLFGRVCAQMVLDRKHIDDARYCLCSALDEAVLQTTWGRTRAAGIDWSTQGLGSTFGYDRQGSDRVYQIIGEARNDPHSNHDLLEICQGILERGFQGRYRYKAGGTKQLQAVHKEVKKCVKATKAPARQHIPGSGSIPPVSQQVGPGDQHAQLSRRRFWWLGIGSLVIVLAGMAGYGIHRYQRHHQAQQMPPVDVLARNLGAHLRDQIAAGTVSLSENASHTSLTLRFSGMFAPNQTGVNTWVAPVVAVAGQQAAALPISVTVAGYTNALPPDKRAMKRLKQTLSGARAIEVTRILLASGMRAEHITITEKVHIDPVASNGAAGHTRNRRVELIFSVLHG